MTTLLDLVKHYQRIIEKHPQDEQKVLKAIDKLFNLDVKVQHLQETGVGRTVNALRKEPGMVGKAARALVYKWKLMVANEESDQEEDHNDISPQNGSEKDSDDAQHNQSRSDKDYQQMNGNHSGSKRKYHSSEEEGPDTKKSRHSHLNESDDQKRKLLQPKIEPESDSQTSDSHSESDSESESSEEERKSVKIKTEPKDKPTNSKYATTNHSKHTTSESSSSKRSHESAEQNGSKHSKHSSESRHSSDKSSKSAHSSRDKEQASDKKHSSEKYHKTDKDKSKDRVESKSSTKNSSEKYKSGSHKTDSGSDRYKEQEKIKTDHSSSRSDKEKHKSSSEKEDKQKSKESSLKEKSSSSKDRTKDGSSSSKEKAKSSSSSHSKSEKKQSTSSDKSDKSKSESRSKSDKGEETSGEKKSSHRSSSSHKHSSSSSKSKEHKPKKNVTINTDSDEDGIGCESGASFAEALGMVLPTKSKKKQSTTPIKDAFSPNTTGNDLSPLSLLNPHARLAPLPALEISALPDISPNYKPRPPPKCIPHFTEEELGAAITSKNLRTKVYSGNKIVGKIPSLYDMCVQVLQEHIDALEYTGGVPYEILKPVVDKATPQQLFILEHYNPYLMEDTDHLWQKHCEKLFRNKKRQEMETWREMFMRCQEEQENKLKSLTANIKLTQEAKKAPIKQTKMAYVDSVVKPPRNVARKQAQHGTAHAATASPAARVASLAAQPNVLRGGVRAPPAPPTSASSFNKPKKAPLMAKALQLMRGRKR